MTVADAPRMPAGAASGDLNGTYLNPTIAFGAVTDAKMANSDLHAQLVQLHCRQLAGLLAGSTSEVLGANVTY